MPAVGSILYTHLKKKKATCLNVHLHAATTIANLMTQVYMGPRHVHEYINYIKSVSLSMF